MPGRPSARLPVTLGGAAGRGVVGPRDRDEFALEELQQTVDLVALADQVAEGTELLQVSVSPGSGYVAGTGSA